MQAIKVKVTRSPGSKSTAPNDEERLGVELNASNNYSASFDAIWVHAHGIDCYCIKESDKKVVIAKLGEITVRELPVVVQEV